MQGNRTALKTGRARPVAADGAGVPFLALRFPGNPVEVRRALEKVMTSLEPLGLSTECAASTELVLAEVLNNVVEHAYAHRVGLIDVELRRSDSEGLICTVLDAGAPMPDGTPPLGHQALLDVPLEELPEGGFGWYLIRSLTRDLDYCRERDCNRLTFRLPLDRRGTRG